MQPEERAMKALVLFQELDRKAPLTIQRDIVAAAIREAVAAEREACAKEMDTLVDRFSSILVLTKFHLRKFPEAIRARKE